MCFSRFEPVALDFSGPGKPTDSSYVERFNGTLREECLNVHWFETIKEAREIAEAWRTECVHRDPGYAASSSK